LKNNDWIFEAMRGEGQLMDCTQSGPTSEFKIIAGSTVTYQYDDTNSGDVVSFIVTVLDNKLGTVGTIPRPLA
jgi:hypothetical protein